MPRTGSRPVAGSGTEAAGSVSARGAAGLGAAALGILGPVAFVGSWAVASLTTSASYSILVDPISRLAAIGAPTRAGMTLGFVVFGISVVGFSIAVRRAVGMGASLSTAATAIATLLVAAFPLDRSDLVDRLHGTFAAIGYVTLVLVPVLANGPLRRSGRSWLPRLGLAAAAISSASLIATTLVDRVGLWQRVGLTVLDAWLVVLAVVLVVEQRRRGRDSAATG